MEDNSKRQGTRVFKKSSPNGKITVYLGKRDFVDHITHVDPIDGVVLIDPEYLKDRKVYGHVLAAFRYGREDLDVLGLTFRKDLYLASEQIFPLDPNQKRPLTRLQERLIKKLGSNAFPFFFELPPHCPASVTLQPAPGDMGKPCGVDYELKAYVGDTVDDKPHKRNSVRLAIRKVMYAPSKQGEQPSVEVSKEFMMSPNKLHLEASLDKELYYHGETVAVNVHIQNNSNKSVKKIKVTIRQFADICLFSTAQYKCTVAEVESEVGCPVGPGFSISKVFSLSPLLFNNRDKWGLALDGKLKDEDTNLASSTVITDSSQKENLGIIVQYKVKVKLILGPLVGDLVAELPFTLMHPKPEEEPEPLGNNKGASPAGGAPTTTTEPQEENQGPTVDTNLIELDTGGCVRKFGESMRYSGTEKSRVNSNDIKRRSFIDSVRSKLELLRDKLTPGVGGNSGGEDRTASGASESPPVTPPATPPPPLIHKDRVHTSNNQSPSISSNKTNTFTVNLIDLAGEEDVVRGEWVYLITCMGISCVMYRLGVDLDTFSLCGAQLLEHC